MTPRERIFVALDTRDEDRALDLTERLAGRVGGFKIGLELFTGRGPGLVRRIADSGPEVFLDLKLHDIPNTVSGAVASVAGLGARYLTVHALGGIRMIAAAVEAARGPRDRGPLILAVTVLTSLDERDLGRLGIDGPCDAAVVRLAAIAREAGADGVVCSPLEVTAVREAFPSAVIFVPGIRPRGASADDQSRIATPAEAIARGADRLVIGRAITRAPDPAAAAAAIAAEIAAGE